MLKRILYGSILLLLFCPFTSCEHAKQISQTSRADVHDKTAQMDYSIEENLVYYTNPSLIDSMKDVAFSKADFNYSIYGFQLDSLMKAWNIPDYLFDNPGNFRFEEMLDEWGRSLPLTKVSFLVDPIGALEPLQQIDQPLVISITLNYEPGATDTIPRPPGQDPAKPYQLSYKLHSEYPAFSDEFKSLIQQIQNKTKE